MSAGRVKAGRELTVGDVVFDRGPIVAARPHVSREHPRAELLIEVDGWRAMPLDPETVWSQRPDGSWWPAAVEGDALREVTA